MGDLSFMACAIFAREADLRQCDISPKAARRSDYLFGIGPKIVLAARLCHASPGHILKRNIG